MVPLSRERRIALRGISWAAFVLVLFMLLIAVHGCGKHAPAPEPSTIRTESWTHEVLEMVEPSPTGPRGDIPAGVDASDVVSQQTFSHAGGAVGKITTVQESKGLFRKPKKSVTYNCNNCHGEGKQAPSMPLSFTTPEDPWWKWPLYIFVGGIIGFIIIKLWPVLSILEKVKKFIPWG